MAEILQKISFSNEVDKLIKKQLNTYKNDHDRIISDYHAEKQITDAYNGRQILELLQNADDAGTDTVLIELDREQNILRIANNGTPFDINGVKSLMLAYKSSKNKRNYIGNKGLGFRSVLNWVTEVKIKTKQCFLEFSPNRAHTLFYDLIKDTVEQQEMINNEEELQENEVPFGILSVPKLILNDENQVWETIIELTYNKEFEKDILKQLEDLKPEILLFINNTREIKIEGAGDLDQILVRKDHPSSVSGLTKVEVNEIIYNVFNSGEMLLPKRKKKYYSFKVAWREELSDENSRFFTYFPTQVNTHLPFLIHGTFDLDPTRNHFNESDDNDFILEKIAETIGKLTLQYLKKKDLSDWKAYQFLTPTGRSENIHLKGFFEKIEQLRSSLKIYPCLDGTYVSKENALFHGNRFSEWVIRNKIGRFFFSLIIPTCDDLYVNLGHSHKYSTEKLIEVFNKVTFHIASVEERAQLIKILADGQFEHIKSSDKYMPLLLNSKNEPVVDQDKVFLEEDKDYEIPQDLIPISFLSRNLYEELLIVLEEELQDLKIKDENISRPLKRYIGDIVNVGARDINEVIRFIVTEINNRIEVASDEKMKVQMVLELNKILFSIFQTNKERKGTLNLRIPVLNRLGELITADKLFLGKSFPSGVVMEEIFQDIYYDKDYVCDASQLRFSLDLSDSFEEYLLWIGVVKYTKLDKYEEILRRSSDNYSDFVFKQVGRPQDVTTIEYSVIKISNFKEVSANLNFTIEKLIAWILLDPRLQNALEFNNDGNSFKHSYYNSEKILHWKPSYIFYQFHNFVKINQQFYLSDIDYSEELGFDSINLENSIFRKLDRNEEDIRSILHRLKIKSRFSDLSINEAYKVLAILPDKDEEKKYGRRLYQYFYKTYRNSIPQEFDGITLPTKLLAKKDGSKVYVKRDEIFYTDNATLPKIITDKIWMFDYPKRTGEQKVSQLFGVKTLKDIDVIIDSKSILTHTLDREFQRWYSIIKPYVLTYRLLTLSGKELKNEAVKLLQGTAVRIVSDFKYKFLDEEWHDLKHGEFMVDKESNYFICCNRSFSLEEAKQDPAFSEAFAEVLTTIFKVNDHKDDYRLIFQDRSSLSQTKFLIDRNELKQNLEEAQNFLGLSSLDLKFWKKLFKAKELLLPDDVVTRENLRGQLENNFNFKLPENYVNVDLLEGNNQETYDFLNNVSLFFRLELEEVLPKDSSGLYFYYLRKLEHVIKDHKGEFNQVIWEWLKNEKNQQKNLIKFQTNYDNLAYDIEVQQSLMEFKYNLSLDFSNFLQQWVESKFKLKISGEGINLIPIHNSYTDLLEQYSASLDVIEDEEIRSLFYFEGNDDYITNYLKSLIAKEKEEDEKISGKNKTIGRIVNGKVEKKSFKKGKSKRNNHVHSNSQSKRKQQIGRKSEELVFNTLEDLDNVEKVNWVSGSSKTVSDRSDAKHYDIEYKLKGEEEWKLVEVKTYNGSYFHLSWAEKDTAIKYKENYEIALVNGTDIYMLKDLFQVDFEDNKLFEAVPSEFIISLKIIPFKEE